MKNSSSENNRPDFVFDGDCAFCTRWIERWRSGLRDKIHFVSYQQFDSSASGIEREEFRKSVYFFESGRTSRAAEAVCRMLAYDWKRRWLLWCYQFLPGFKPLSEAVYRLIAANRVFFSAITKFLWGGELRPPVYFFSRRYFIAVLAFIYATAFASLWIQIPGLYGPDGILDAGHYLARIGEYFKGSWLRFYAVPTLAWFDASPGFLRGICAAGFLLSGLVLAGRAVRLSLFILWALYLSLVTAGQDFLSFQWDTLLLETGFLAIFWAPAQRGIGQGADWQSKHIPFGRGLLVLLLFKLMFSSGAVKFASGDPSWRDFSALGYHYYTQPLPSPLSWFIHQFPAAFHKLCTAVMFFIEWIAPFFLFFPRNIRVTGVFLIAALQIAILLTGNYCFFNLLALALCLPAIDDAVWKKKRIPAEVMRPAPALMRILVIPVAIVFAAVSSCQVARIFQVKLPWYAPALEVERALRPFSSLNGYGLFAVMTKRRGEIFVEGSDDGKLWKAYEFKFKPGKLDRLPQFVAPYQPRLDWQMWFAALGTAEQNQWFVNFCVRLLQGTPSVLSLMKNNPFPVAPPKYLRAVTYDYRFTTPEERKKTGAWWKRTFRESYLPVISLSGTVPKEEGTAPGKSADELEGIPN